jgi:hypothetical protein
MNKTCPECGNERTDWSRVCGACGAPPGEHRAEEPAEGIRTTDVEPYVTLRYIARLFKILAGLILIMLIGEVTLGLVIDGGAALSTLLGEATRLLVMAGLLWGAGDMAVLMIDAGHDLRVTRILLGRINARLQELRGVPAEGAAGQEATGGPPDRERRAPPTEEREPALPVERSRRS